MSEQVEKIYIALADIGCSIGVIKSGKKVPENIVKDLGGYEVAKKAGSICLKSEYDKIVHDQKKKDNEAIKKGEDARKEMIKKREARKNPVEKESIKK